jgi:hypothetical protein
MTRIRFERSARTSALSARSSGLPCVSPNSTPPAPLGSLELQLEAMAGRQRGHCLEFALEAVGRGPWPGLGPSGYVPPHWSAAPAPPPADLGMLMYRDGRLLAGADGHTVAVDPDTLDIADAGP